MLIAIALGVLYWVDADPHPLRLRPAGERAQPERGAHVGGQPEADGPRHDAPERRGGRADRPADADGQHPLLRRGFPAGLGFDGIAVALLGQYHAVGMAVGALLFGFLDYSSGGLQLADIEPEVVAIMKGTIMLTAVIAFTVVRRLADAAEVRECRPNGWSRPRRRPGVLAAGGDRGAAWSYGRSCRRRRGPSSRRSVEPIDDFYRRLMRERWFPIAAQLVAFLVLVILTNQFDAVALTAPGTFRQMLILGSPILLAGLGGLYCERAGIVNIGLEGMMTLGTWFAAWGGIRWGPWAARLRDPRRGAGRVVARHRHRRVRRRPHRLGRGDQHPRPRHHPLPVVEDVRQPGRRVGRRRRLDQHVAVGERGGGQRDLAVPLGR